MELPHAHPNRIRNEELGMPIAHPRGIRNSEFGITNRPPRGNFGFRIWDFGFIGARSIRDNWGLLPALERRKFGIAVGLRPTRRTVACGLDGAPTAI